MPGEMPAASKTSFWLLAVLTASFCVWVMTMPVFPTQDGPMHLYIATILGDLLSHSSALYAHYYYIRHILPPYSLHYYLLIALMKGMSAPMAEKIVVCIILVNFAFGFRYLATAIGAAGGLFSLLIVAILLNWPLGMGFENFSLALGMACWALGLWTCISRRKLEESNTSRYRIGFVLLLFLMLLTHPIPVLITLGFAALDLVLRALFQFQWEKPKPFPDTLRRGFVNDLLTWCAGASTLIYIYFFTDRKRSLAEAEHQHLDPRGELLHFLRLTGLEYFRGGGKLVHLYHYMLYAVLFLGVLYGIVAMYRRLREGTWHPVISWIIAVFLIVPLLCVIPMDINGSHFLAQRLLILPWLAALAAASGVDRVGKPVVWFIHGLAVCITATVLWMGQLYVRPEARLLAALERMPIVRSQQVGLLLPANDAENSSGHLTFSPLEWSGTYYFRKSGSVLLNTPWMDQPHLPLGAKPSLLTYQIPSNLLEQPDKLRSNLLASQSVANEIMPEVNFIMFAGYGQQVEEAVAKPVLKLDPIIANQCQVNESFLICFQ